VGEPADPLLSGKQGRAEARPCGISRIRCPVPQIQRLFRVLGVIGQDCGPKLTPNFKKRFFALRRGSRGVKILQFFPRKTQFIRNPFPADD